MHQAVVSVVIGTVMLAGFLILNMGMSSIHSAQLNTTVALNRYRIASKMLTYNIQSYAVTGSRDIMTAT